MNAASPNRIVQKVAKRPKPREARLWEALIPVAALIVTLATNLGLYGGQPHIPLVLGTIVACFSGLVLGHPWKTIEDGMVKGIAIALKAILILLIIGMLIGSWIASGVVPLLIFYGLKLLSPEIFLVASCLICCVVSVITGSSWTTAGTVGVALIAVGQGFQVPLPMVAGAIISGAYFGDKMSPLSDTTNLTPAVAGSELFEHIRHMMYTTIPALLLALVLYALIGMRVDGTGSNPGELTSIVGALEENFHLSPWLLSAPLLVLLLVMRKIPAMPALIAGSILGTVLAVTLQEMEPGSVLQVLKEGYLSNTGNKEVDALLTRGGISGMMDTVALILCAMSFGGVMERTGMLKTLANAILRLARSTGSLVACTAGTCLGMNVIAPDQYLSIVVPGRMYRGAYQQVKLHPKNLSRILEDAGTLTSPLIAYNTCGAYMSQVLGVSAFAYFPFAFLNLLVPLISIAYGFTGWTITPLKEDRTRG